MNHFLTVDENDAHLCWLDVRHPVTLRDAVYATGILEGLLLRERRSSLPRQQRIGLDLGFTDSTEGEAITEFCSYLEETNELYALFLRYLPLPHYYRLLAGLCTTTRPSRSCT
jgi:hypothetical protein